MSHRSKNIAFFLFMLSMACPRVFAAAPTEYQVQAAFLLNFCEFIQWPARAYHGDKSPLVIGVLGVDPFGKILDDTVAGVRIDGHRIVIQRASNVDELRACQVVYVCQSERNHLEEILATLDPAPVLTVAEIDGFCVRGGVIDFYLDEHKMRFEINMDGAQRHGLKISAQLLSRAKVTGASANIGN